MPIWSTRAPLFADRRHAGRELADSLVRAEVGADPIVYGLARGGVPVAAEVSRALGAPLDALAVRKIGHPLQPELALGAVAAGGPPVVRDLPAADERAQAAISGLARRREEEAGELEERLHANVPALDPSGQNCILVDDGLATGATMVAACRWAWARGASCVVVGVPVASTEGASDLRAEADIVVCPHEVTDFGAVSIWYGQFTQVSEAEVETLLAESRPSASP